MLQPSVMEEKRGPGNSPQSMVFALGLLKFQNSLSTPSKTLISRTMENKAENKVDHKPEVDQTNEIDNIKTAHIAIQTDTFAIDEDALGLNLPKNYYHSIGFIGTVIVSPTG
jgi:hypothetical protein